MDWGKVKSIFIIIFLFVNVFLVYRLMDANNRNTVPKEVIEDTLQILKAAGIEVSCKIPDRMESMKVMQFKVKSSDLQHGRSIYEKGKPGSVVKKVSPGELKKDIMDFLKDLKDKGVDTGKYAFDGKVDIAGGKGSVILREVYDRKYMIFNNFMVVYISEGHIEKLTFSGIDEYYTVYEPKDVKPINEILLLNYRGDILDGGAAVLPVIISDIRPGYLSSIGDLPGQGVNDVIKGGASLNNASVDNTGNTDVIETFQAVPCWRVSLQDGREIFYNAYTGEKIR